MTTTIEDDTPIIHWPKLEIAQWRFSLTLNDELVQNKQEIKQKLLNAIKENEMGPFYDRIGSELGQVDTQLLSQLKAANEKKLKELDAAIVDAQEHLGESEIREANLAKAEYLNKIGDKDAAVTQYRKTEELTVGSGQKLDVIFTLIRIGMFWNDHDLINRNIEKAKGMEDKIDWDRKNRLRVYEAVYFISTRRLAKAAQHFLDTLATFSAVELLDYETYIYYTILSSVFAFDRVTLQKKVINAPEVLQVIDKLKDAGSLMDSLYNCNYSQFMVALAAVSDNLKRDRYWSAHAGFFTKEMRVKAYTQILESYRSVQLESMASSFGVGVDFMDKEISRFIASGRLQAKIDKVGGVIETNRVETKAGQYQDTLKSGDQLLNRIQKLSRFVNL